MKFSNFQDHKGPKTENIMFSSTYVNGGVTPQNIMKTASGWVNSTITKKRFFSKSSKNSKVDLKNHKDIQNLQVSDVAPQIEPPHTATYIYYYVTFCGVC